MTSKTATSPVADALAFALSARRPRRLLAIKLVAEFNGSADRLAREILRLRVAMGHIAQAATMAREGREFSFLRAKPVEPQVRS